MNRPASNDAKVVLQWLNDNAKNPHDIQAFLAECRAKEFAETLDLNDPNQVILHALTTTDIRTISADRLRKAMLMPGSDVIQLIALIVEALKIILQYLESSGLCKKADKHAKELFLKALQDLTGNNPFINLAKAHLHDKDLSKVKLQFANLDGADLRRTNLSEALLCYANLAHADCNQTNFTNANCDEVDLKWTNLKNAKMVEYDSEDYTLKAYLQTTWPTNAKFTAEVTKEEMNEALTQIDAELSAEKKLHPHSFIQKMYRHLYHQTVANNINNVLVNKDKNLANSKTVLLDAFEAGFFKNHGSAHVAEKINAAAIKVHNFLHRNHKRTEPLVGNSGQNILIKGLDMIDSWMHPKKTSAPKLTKP